MCLSLITLGIQNYSSAESSASAKAGTETGSWTETNAEAGTVSGAENADSKPPGENQETVGQKKSDQPRGTLKIAKGRVRIEPTPIYLRFISFFGLIVMLSIAFIFSHNRRAVNFRLVLWGVGLQFTFALFILVTPFGRPFFSAINSVFLQLLQFTEVGTNFLVKSFVSGKVDSAMANFLFQVLPTIIFFSSLMSVLYHLGVMQGVVRVMAWVMQKTMRLSGAESMSAAANIFVGQTEAPLVIKPFVKTMTMSELTAIMTGGFATVAGGVLAAYVGMLKGYFPDIAGHLMAASIMNAPAGLVCAKIFWPEEEVPKTMGQSKFEVEKVDSNVIGAAARGASEGMTLVLNVAAMLLAFIALVAMLNYGINYLGSLVGLDLTLQKIIGTILSPLAFVMGIPWQDATIIGGLLGEKIILNEFISFSHLGEIVNGGKVIISERAAIIATYAMLGFANLGSIAIQIGGIGGIAPSRRQDLAKLGFRAMAAGSLAAYMSACIAGILI